MIIPDSNSASSGYDIDNSLKLEADNAERMQRSYANIGTPTSEQKATISLWVKRTELQPSGNHICLIGYTTNTMILGFNNDRLSADFSHAAGTTLRSTAVFKDTSAWYHLVWAFDTTQATASNRAKMYVNGVQITAFDTETYPTQNSGVGLWEVNMSHYIGWSDAQCQSGYVAEVYLIDGQQLDPTDFGEFDTKSGIWRPIEYTGTFGNEGYYLDFEDSADLGADQSGNGNDFGSLYNITSADQATDTPTNNFCTLRPAYEPKASITLKEGGTVWQNLGNSNSAFQPNTTAIGTFQLSAGKWYWECTWTNDGDRALIGIVASLADIRQTTDWQEFVWWDGYNGWIGSSLIATETNPPAFDSINTIGIALDCDNQRITFSKDGGWLEANGNMNGSSPSDWRWDWTNDSDFLGSVYSNGNVAPMFGIQSDFNTHFTTANVNFGGYAATIRTSGGNSDANGYGNFAYAVPSGFYALCTKNLAKYG